MSTFNDVPKFRGTSTTAVERNAAGIRIWHREVKLNGDGTATTVKVLPPIDLLYTNLSEPVRAEAFGYGMEVKVTRQASFSKDPKTGKAVPVQEKWDAISEIVNHFMSGTESWNLASAGPTLSADVRNLINACVRAFGSDPGEAEEMIRGMSAGDRAQLRVDAEVKPHLDAIYAEQAGSAADAEGLKSRLRGLRKG